MRLTAEESKNLNIPMSKKNPDSGSIRQGADLPFKDRPFIGGKTGDFLGTFEQVDGIPASPLLLVDLSQRQIGVQIGHLAPGHRLQSNVSDQKHKVLR